MAVTTEQRRGIPARGRPLRTTAGAQVPGGRAAGGQGAGRRSAGAPGPAVRLPGRRAGRRRRPARHPGAGAVRRAPGQRICRRRGWRESEHQGRLGFVERVLSAEQVLTPEVAELARAVADRYAGSIADVLRLAVPPRHARTEGEAAAQRAAGIGVTASGVEPDVPRARTRHSSRTGCSSPDRSPHGTLPPLPCVRPPRRRRWPSPPPRTGAGTRRARPFSRRSANAARRVRCGRRCPARTGRRCSPRPRRSPRTRVAGRC